MKKVCIILAYWLAAIILTASILANLGYDIGHSVIMSLSFLPAAMALSYFLPKLEDTLDRRERVLGTIFIILGVMTLLFAFVIDRASNTRWDMPSVLWNPVFVAAILAILSYGHYHLVKWLDKKYPSNRPITFYSVYKKISLKKEDILYIESRDSEVWIYAQDGQQYRNRTGISQWEDVLGSGFVRIHRSYLVNRTYASLSSPESVCVAGKELPVSRKYKEEVQCAFSRETPNLGHD